MNVTRYVVLVYSLACKRRRVIQEVGRQLSMDTCDQGSSWKDEIMSEEESLAFPGDALQSNADHR